MGLYRIKGVITELGSRTLHSDGAMYDYLEIARSGLAPRRVYKVRLRPPTEQLATVNTIGEFYFHDGPDGTQHLYAVRSADGQIAHDGMPHVEVEPLFGIPGP